MHALYLEAFLGSLDSTTSRLAPTASRLGLVIPDLPWMTAYSLAPAIPTAGSPILLRPSFARAHKYRNINLFPISYAFPPRLRGRLTLGRLPLPRKPRVYGERVFHPFYRYSCQHNHFSSVQHTLRYTFCPRRTLPYQTACAESKASAACLAPIHFRRNVIRPVSYYAFFKRWLLLSQRPGCLYNVTTLTTEHAFGGLSCWSGLLPSRQRTLAPAA